MKTTNEPILLKRVLKKILPSPVIRKLTKNRIKFIHFTHRNDISKVMEMLEDNLSKETLRAYMKLRTHDNVELLKRVTRPVNKQYFDESVTPPPPRISDSVFVDMGVLDGGTSIQFTEWVRGKYKALILFEPDEVSYKRSKENIAHLENAVIYNEGASDFCGELYFTGDGGGGSHISNSPTDTKITVSTLDSKLPEIPVPTHIKMDIEGAEIAALHGCTETIKKFKPILSICIYHKISDIWEIPFLIKQLNPTYKIYIRHYDVSKKKSVVEKKTLERDALSWELVCYAIP